MKEAFPAQSVSLWGGYLMAQMVKNPPANAVDVGSIPGSGRFSGKGNGNQLQYACFGEFHEQRSLVGYSLWDHEELDSTE